MLTDNNYNSASEPTEFARQNKDNLFVDQIKSKNVVNSTKLDFLKDIKKPVVITPPEPQCTNFEESDLSVITVN